ncbi:MAG TPA: hypothetical protein VJL89_08210 [Thermodesulfovibrionia bacterium]|nr:hypothetical protein [Thermodesulfovibrionia bacterium]
MGIVDPLGVCSTVFNRGRGFKPGKWLYHFEKHGAEFCYKTSVEYLRGAQRLTARGREILTSVRANGDVLFYDTVTNEFAVVNKQGYIRTYFKPVEASQYWLNQTGGN